MVDISIVHGIINQLITGGAPSCIVALVSLKLGPKMWWSTINFIYYKCPFQNNYVSHVLVALHIPSFQPGIGGFAHSHIGREPRVRGQVAA